MKYSIRNAVSSDLSRLEQIYARARRFMAENGNPNQWGNWNPPTTLLEQDIAQKKLYILADESGIHGVFYFAIEDDPTYGVIEDGHWSLDKPYGVIHRIAGDGSGGILESAIAYCSSQISYLRIDTHHDNTVMQNALEKYAFQRCGIIYLANGDPRIAYDRMF